MFGCALPASGVGAGLLRDEDPPLVVPLVDAFVTALDEVEVDLSEVEGSP